MDKHLFSKEEKTLTNAKYTTKGFPQFQNDELPLGTVFVYITSTQDKQEIMNIFAKPLTELKNKTIENVGQAENALKQMLDTRAASLENLASLRENPRKTLFSTAPGLLANNENPVEAVKQQHKATVNSSVTSFKENMKTWVTNKLLTQETSDALYQIAIAVGTAQDALFQGKETDIQAADTILHSIGMTEPTIAGLTQKAMAQTLMDELTSNVHQTLINNTVGAAKCEKCGKYFQVTGEGKCTFCHLGIGSG